MLLKKGDYVKHFKGENLVEKNIYEIIAVNPVYTGEKECFPELIIYAPLFQEGKLFVREYDDLVKELSPEQKELHHQQHRIDLLTEDELNLIKTEEFIAKKMAYIEEKYSKKKL